MQLINIADLKDPDDPAGRSYREVNRARTHAIPLGALVECEDGIRLWVVYHQRDCDQTPLYELSADIEDMEVHRAGWRNRGWVGPLPEGFLTVILSPEEGKALRAKADEADYGGAYASATTIDPDGGRQ